MASDDDTPTLSPHALAALAAFRAERAAAAAAAAGEAADAGAALLTPEDWELSQFWYAEATSRALAAEVARCAADAAAAAPPGARVTAAFLASPSAFKALRAAGGLPGGARAVLLEFDARFAAFAPDFFAFDYRAPLGALPRELVGAVDVFLLDPPFLNAECLRAFARAVRALARAGAPPRVLLATGAVMLRAARDELGLRPTRLRVEHAAGRLSNPFALFASHAREELGGWDEEAEAAEARGGAGGEEGAGGAGGAGAQAAAGAGAGGGGL